MIYDYSDQINVAIYSYKAFIEEYQGSVEGSKKTSYILSLKKKKLNIPLIFICNI